MQDQTGKSVRCPGHSYINIDRSPWFRNVGIPVSDDGRQKENGELATYLDFVNHIGNLSNDHLARIRALYIEGGIEDGDADRILNTPSILSGKKVLIVDEVARTGATLSIAMYLFRLAFPDAKEICGTYFWHPAEALLMVGQEKVLTSLPVWYDPNSLFGRGIGGIEEEYYKARYLHYKEADYPQIDLKKLYTHAFSASVFSAPLLKEDGTVLDLSDEGLSRKLFREFKKLKEEFESGHILFTPPLSWSEDSRFEKTVKKQGLLLIPEGADKKEREEILNNPAFYLNFREKLKTYNY